MRFGTNFLKRCLGMMIFYKMATTCTTSGRCWELSCRGQVPRTKELVCQDVREFISPIHTGLSLFLAVGLRSTLLENFGS